MIDKDIFTIDEFISSIRKDAEKQRKLLHICASTENVLHAASLLEDYDKRYNQLVVRCFDFSDKYEKLKAENEALKEILGKDESDYFSKIKRMTLEELAGFINELTWNCVKGECGDCILGKFIGGCNTHDITNFLKSKCKEN